MLEDGWAVTREMVVVLDGAPLGLADQPWASRRFSLDQRQVAQVVNLIGWVYPLGPHWRLIANVWPECASSSERPRGTRR